jgi:GNAT superfamily N-acetyltransferase
VRAGIKIRFARDYDKPRFAELMSVFTDGRRLTPREVDNRFRLIRRDSGQALLVATAGGFVVGILAFRIRHNLESVSQYGEIATIAVDAAWRKQGVGAALVLYAEKLAKRRKCIGLWLVSGFAREEQAHQFYERLGFIQTGVRFIKPAE